MILKIIIGIMVIIIYTIVFHLVDNVYKGYKLVYDISHPKRTRLLDLENIPFSCRKFIFYTKDKIKISAIEYMPNIEPKGTIIACHYLGGSKTSIYTYIEPLLYNGFTVVAFDYPNHGESMDRKSNRFTLEDDMRRFLIRIKQLGIQGPYGTMGFSMGATIAISATDYMPEIKAIVVDSGPLIFVYDYFLYVLQDKDVKNKIMRIVFLFFYLYVLGFHKMSRRMVKRLSGMTGRPILMIHNKKDKVISYKNAEYIHRLMNSGDLKLVSMEKGHHLTNRVMLGQVYDYLINGFFEEHLSEENQL